MEYPFGHVGKRAARLRAEVLLYAAQLGWIHALDGRAYKEDTEYAPISKEGKILFDIMEEFGYEWDWRQFETYLIWSENIFGLTFQQVLLLREAMIALKNALIASAEEGAEPPYMSEAYRLKRQRAQEQAQQFNDDRNLAKRGR